MVQGQTPDWRPLLEVAGDEVTGGFMWMYDVRLASGRYLQAYKHFYTRRYVFLDAGCNAFAYLGHERYGPIALADALEAALSPWWERLEPRPRTSPRAGQQSPPPAERRLRSAHGRKISPR
jgi:hypothetical protein